MSSNTFSDTLLIALFRDDSTFLFIIDLLQYTGKACFSPVDIKLVYQKKKKQLSILSRSIRFKTSLTGQELKIIRSLRVIKMIKEVLEI